MRKLISLCLFALIYLTPQAQAELFCANILSEKYTLTGVQQQWRLRNQRFAREVVEINGPLDQYLRQFDVEMSTVQVYLFGSSSLGFSLNPLKKDRPINSKSDIDLFIIALKKDGTPWQIHQGHNKAFIYQGLDVEVISKYLRGGLDVDLFNNFGIETYTKDMEQEIPPFAIRLR